MALTLDFDTPASSSPRTVAVTGTVAKNSVGYLTIRLNVTDKTSHAINRSFYRVISYDNSNHATLDVTAASCTLSIAPKLLDSETIDMSNSGVEQAWSYTI